MMKQMDTSPYRKEFSEGSGRFDQTENNIFCSRFLESVDGAASDMK
jgi:hypothetical protein